MIPDNIVTIATGGITTAHEVTQLAEAGFDAVIIGRALLAGPDAKTLARDIRSYRPHRAPMFGM